MNSLIGGILIGFSGVTLLLFLGKILGVSGICGSLINFTNLKDNKWRIFFLIGMFSTSIYLINTTSLISKDFFNKPLYIYALAGLLVGFGSQMANGCTSGHSICGISRLSIRSITATIVFITVAAITVFLNSKL